VVLDVNDVTDYSAFLLPNPFRLIIDIHGGAAPGPMVSAAPAPPATAMVSAAPVVKHDANTYATDLADLSKRADKVRATTVPTSGPIAAVTPSSELAKELQQAHAEETVQTPASATPAADAAANDGYPPPPPAPAAKHSKRLSGMSVPAPAPLPEPTPLTPTARTTETPESGAPTEHEADLTAAGQRSLARALGLKVGRIVIDAGHGGHDTGTIGAGGIYEKDVVLDVALRLGKLLHERLGVDVIYTRSDDTFIPLETRTAIANKAQADLFLSIHANSSSDASARGVETYYLNFTSDPNALEVAARENAVSQSSMYQLSDLVKKITLKDKIDESREFALDVDTALYAGLERGNAGLKNRGIKKAPFVVLIGANMPSILTEISFVTNPKDAAELETPEYRERVAESIYKGVAKYASGLSGVKPTARAEADEPRATVAQR
jgi:N-acetylmuramoyl-L-alanine amidase